MENNLPMKTTSYILLWADGLTDTDFEGYPTLEDARATALNYAKAAEANVAIWSEAKGDVVDVIAA
jgi:hypothetical protein